jgi:hypothetical protein
MPDSNHTPAEAAEERVALGVGIPRRVESVERTVKLDVDLTLDVDKVELEAVARAWSPLD